MHGKKNVDFTTPLGEIKTICNVLYIPNMKKKLLFVGTIANKSFTIFFYAKKCTVVNPKKPNSIVAHGNIVPKNGLCKLEFCVANINRNDNKAMKETKLWHRRTGHVDFKSLHELNTNKVVTGVLALSTLDETCAGCMVGKQSREKFPPKAFRQIKAMLELVHMNRCGPLSVPFMSRSRYFITFTNDYNRRT